MLQLSSIMEWIFEFTFLSVLFYALCLSLSCRRDPAFRDFSFIVSGTLIREIPLSNWCFHPRTHGWIQSLFMAGDIASIRRLATEFNSCNVGLYPRLAGPTRGPNGWAWAQGSNNAPSIVACTWPTRPGSELRWGMGGPRAPSHWRF